MKKYLALLPGVLAAAASLHAQAQTLTWIKRTTNHSSEYTMTAATATLTGDKYAVVGYRALAGGGFENRFSTSVDAAAWTAATVIPTTGVVRSLLASQSGFFVTVEDSSTTNVNRILTSVDGATWTNINTGAGSLVSITRALLGVPIVAVGAANGGNNVVLSSDTGVTWRRVNSGFNVDLIKVVFGNNVFLAISRNGTLISSINGTTWTAVPVPGLPAGATFSSITFDGLEFLLLVNDASQRPRVFVSTTGTDWSATGATLGAAFSNGAIAAVGPIVALAGSAVPPSGGLVYTAPLITGTPPVVGDWSSPQVVDPTGTGLNFIVFTNGLWLTGGSNGAVFTAGAPVNARTVPTITVPPVSQTAPPGGSATFSVTAVGNGSGLTYRWLFNNTLIPGATNSTYTVTNVSAANVGTYFVDIGHPGAPGSTTSQPVTLSLADPLVFPNITAQPVSQSAAAGSAVTLSITATSRAGLNYQWFFNGSPIPGATGSSYTIPSVTPANAGVYSVRLTNVGGTTTSNDATLTVTPALPAGAYLTNLSIRSSAGAGAQTLIVGVTIGGAGTGGAKSLLIRGIGPALAAFGVSGALVDPQLALYNGQVVVDANDNWDTTRTPLAAQAAVGAFALTPGSRDAALITTDLAAGSYSVQITGTGGATGIALAEIYDLTPAANVTGSTRRLINVSARTQVGLGGDILIAGFNISGTGTRRLLIRGIGPTLAGFGVTGTLADPKLDIYSGQAVIASNDNWNATDTPLATQIAAGGFALAADSRDAVLIVNLAPGSYSAQVSGVGATTGVALVEIYELP